MSVASHHTALATVLAATVAAALAAGWGTTVQAQSAYTMTVLSKPSGASSFAPTTLDNLGVVHGGMNYAAGLISGRPLCRLFCTGYLYRAVSWGNASTSSVGATVEGKFLFPLASNDKGTQVGPYSTVMEKEIELPVATYPAGNYDDLAARRASNLRTYAKTTSMRRGTTDTNIVSIMEAALGKSNTSQFPSEFNAQGLNNSDVAVGIYTVTKATADGLSTEYTFTSRPVVFRNNAVSLLPLGAYAKARPLGINDAGTIAGVISRAVDPGFFKNLPALWVNDQLSVVGDDSLANFVPVSINSAGLTKINGTAGESIVATAMNDQGTVTGCKMSYQADAQVDAKPFIWRNGVMSDLTQEITAKGVKLPAGSRLGCPLAINNSGSILSYTYTSTAPRTITWVRLNAKP
ncbi:MAG: hypothetical protein EOP38_04350 [Rubrivivax sp.]|nr:MAG: hypothetical protein EOP38_04350 [Rubrivivax sp.]